MSKRFNYILFLVLKTIIAFGVIWFLFKKFSEFTKTYALSLNIWDWIPTQNQHLFVIALVLVCFNWGLETIKWNLLLKRIYPQSFLKSLADVLRGISISIFTPNRNGEFIGRIYAIPNYNKLKALELYLVGSLSQQLFTVLFGFTALMFTDFSSYIKWTAVVLLIITTLAIYKINWLFNLSSRFKFLQGKIEVLKSIETPLLVRTIIISGIRYLVFFTQYFLLFKAFGLEVSPQLLITIIPCIFFVGSYVPSFALLEMGVKSIIAVYLFSNYTNNQESIVLASFSIWIINVSLPALIGVWPLLQSRLKNNILS